MFYTYILKSKKRSGAIYIGSTSDLKARVKQHNNPTSDTYSKRHTPWIVETYIAFQNLADAKKFEKYLKSSSGKAFMRKRLLSNQFVGALRKFNNGRAGNSAKPEA